jgi:acyl CoA:acetate/3-ketoacid CoA transferase alpha subunit
MEGKPELIFKGTCNFNACMAGPGKIIAEVKELFTSRFVRPNEIHIPESWCIFKEKSLRRIEQRRLEKKLV